MSFFVSFEVKPCPLVGEGQLLKQFHFKWIKTISTAYIVAFDCPVWSKVG